MARPSFEMPRIVFWVTGSTGLVIAAAVIAAVVLLAPQAPIGVAIFLGVFLGFGITCFITMVCWAIFVRIKAIEHAASLIARQKPPQPLPHGQGPNSNLN